MGMATTKADDHWLEHVRRWKASGLPRGKYAAKAGLNPQTLGWYAWKLKGVLGKASPTKISRTTGAVLELAPGVPVVEVLPAPAPASALELEFGDVTVRVPVDFEASTLSRLLDVLEARR